ncbi:PH domain-containing protein [Flavobacterium sp.]|uniref:PH domain-containing protein n=1 Tax=Flavobacterium sp. TaxID=239 RepID=UPI0028BE971A|nr:PH domain-containing protein [Flavobacterium sp.]
MTEKANFNQPQRQSLIGVLVMFTDTLQKIIRGMWPILVVWIFKFNQMNKLYIGLGVLAVVVLVGIIAYLQYLNFTFFIDEENDEFIINKGVLNKSKIAIQLHKIQQVNINQTLIQKIIGVHALDVDTAGSNKKEVSIRAISHDLAIALKTRLLSESHKVTVDDSANETVSSNEEPFIKIGFPSLLKIGITSNYVRSFFLILAFFFTIYENVNQFLRSAEVDGAADAVDEKIDGFINANMAIYSGLIFLLVIFALIIIVNLVRTIIRYFDFKIAKQNRSLVLSYGLLNTKNTIIRPEKVQIVALSQNWLQKKMNVLNIKIKQASGNENNPENKKSAIEIPGCNAVEKDEILKLLFSQIPQNGEKLLPNWRYLLFPTIFYIIIPVAILLFFVLKTDWISVEYLTFLPFYLAFVLVMLYFSFRHYRLFVNEQYIIKQSGAWDIDREIIEPHKIQSIKVSQLFWHKSVNIGSLTITTAGGSFSFRLANFDTVKALANLWLYQVETTDKNWM